MLGCGGKGINCGFRRWYWRGGVCNMCVNASNVVTWVMPLKCFECGVGVRGLMPECRLLVLVGGGGNALNCDECGVGGGRRGTA
ncbi:hypothetical protein HNY73_014457 [Argiope bruennichi]|uniref:Uncharacterized protein n=1 Tax=Argiope bruennichi TaxID=94029 RepID=A0A8T0ETE0_ARGBR|nr:hypothetical protein HNY73_014457 [Argiope bruennichi]